MSNGQQTEKARQVRAEKRTLEDVVRALQDLIDRDLIASGEHRESQETEGSGTSGTQADRATEEVQHLPEAPDHVWDEDIPVLREVVFVPPEDGDKAGPWLDAARIALIIRRAVRKFNERTADRTPLSPAAAELLEHLIFEEWGRPDADARAWDEDPEERDAS